MKQESFYNYKDYRYLRIGILLLILMTVIYLIDSPMEGRNGGTFLGYTYGVIAAAGVFYLMWYGMQRRSYNQNTFTVRGALSAHVWIGIGLVFLVPLHCAFQFGFNLHTLAYVLMVLTVLTGIWGGILYARLASEVRSHRGGRTIETLAERVESLREELSTIDQDASSAFIAFKNSIDRRYEPTLLRCLFGQPVGTFNRKNAVIGLDTLGKDEREKGLEVIKLVDEKFDLLNELKAEVAVQAWLKIWLYFHVPLSFACVIALVGHIVTVFYFW